MTYSNALPHAACPTPRKPAALTGPFSTLRALLTLRRSRAALASLSAEQLEDVGLTRAEARREATRAPWDVPSHWVKK